MNNCCLKPSKQPFEGSGKAFNVVKGHLLGGKQRLFTL
jgi:hypothetical protein